MLKGKRTVTTTDISEIPPADTIFAISMGELENYFQMRPSCKINKLLVNENSIQSEKVPRTFYLSQGLEATSNIVGRFAGSSISILKHKSFAALVAMQFSAKAILG